MLDMHVVVILIVVIACHTGYCLDNDPQKVEIHKNLTCIHHKCRDFACY